LLSALLHLRRTVTNAFVNLPPNLKRRLNAAARKPKRSAAVIRKKSVTPRIETADLMIKARTAKNAQSRNVT